MNGYIGIYKNKKFETYANTTYEAQKKMAQEHNIKKVYEIDVFLAEKKGKEVIHNGAELG